MKSTMKKSVMESTPWLRANPLLAPTHGLA